MTVVPRTATDVAAIRGRKPRAEAQAVWDDVLLERTALAADLTPLADVTWDTWSLRPNWRVRDVVAHLSLPWSFGAAAGAWWLLRAGLRPERALWLWAQDRGQLPSQVLLADLRANVSTRRCPVGWSVERVLDDLLIHGQDVRRPLGLAGAHPSRVVRNALVRRVGRHGPADSRTRAAGLRLAATDVDWIHGDGPTVRGTGEALLMALAGRQVAPTELSGDGVARLLAAARR